MNQALLELDAPASAEGVGWRIGWDHAHHGLVPPPELLMAGTPVRLGWQAGRSVFGRRTLAASRHVRQWLSLRLQAWREGVAFDELQLTPNYLAQIASSHCPVTRRALGGALGGADAARVVRLRAQAAYAPGHLAVVSRAAADALGGCGHRTALEHARAIESGHVDAVRGLDAAAWRRAAGLLSLVTPMPHAQAARLPLALLPPNRVRLLNAPQGLQALVTWQLGAAGWSLRLRQLAAVLDDRQVREEFHLVVGALVPRVLELPVAAAPSALRHALEDLWLHPRIQQRWQHFLLALGEAGTEALVEHAARLDLVGRRALVHTAGGAVEGWQQSPPATTLCPSAVSPTRRRPAGWRPGPRPVTTSTAAAR